MIYILHFDTPYKHAEHYTGYSHDPARLKKRLWHHQNGTSHARLMKAVHDARITYTVAIIIEGDRTLERRIKQRGVKRICPICHPEHNLGKFINHNRKECARELQKRRDQDQ